MGESFQPSYKTPVPRMLKDEKIIFYIGGGDTRPLKIWSDFSYIQYIDRGDAYLLQIVAIHFNHTVRKIYFCTPHIRILILVSLFVLAREKNPEWERIHSV